MPRTLLIVGFAFDYAHPCGLLMLWRCGWFGQDLPAITVPEPYQFMENLQHPYGEADES